MTQVIQRRRERRYLERFAFYLSCSMIVLMFILCLASYFTSQDPTAVDLTQRFQPPSAAHWAGTDQFGRDILTRIMYSMRSFIMISMGAVLVGATLGSLIGLVAGVARPGWRRLMMSVVDGFIAFPGILLALLIIFILGKGQWNTVVAISLMLMPTFAKLAYSTTLEVLDKDFVKAAYSYGLSRWEILFRHVLPFYVPKLITQASGSVASSMMIESSLSFLGLGVQPPNASLGLMMNEAQQYALLYPYMILPTGIVLVSVVLAFIMLGDSLNDRWQLRMEVWDD